MAHTDRRSHAADRSGLNPSARGFTLIELMVVVVLIAILAVVAVASYKKYQRSARVQDGVTHVADIRMKQETFFSTYSRYVSSTDAASNFDGDRQSGDYSPYYRFANVCPNPANAWCNLGFDPPGMQVDAQSDLFHFQFQTMGWAPDGPNPPDPPYQDSPDDRWLMVRARGLPDSEERCYQVTYAHNVPELIIEENLDCD